MLLAFQDISRRGGLFGRGGPGPSPIGHHELELMLSICLQINHEGLNRDGPLPNPLWHPAVKPLRAPFLEYLGKHPERAAALQRQPRRFSIPSHAWKQHYTLLRPLDRNGRKLHSTPLAAPFNKGCVGDYTYRYSTRITALLDREEGQTVSIWDISALRSFLALEIRYLKGCDLRWAPVDSPADVGWDDLTEQDMEGGGEEGYTTPKTRPQGQDELPEAKRRRKSGGY